MSRPVQPVSFGHDVLGPIVAEFCLRLWSLASLMDHRDDAALLFCARGGLRMQLAYERFLAASRLPSPVRCTPLMVSRVVAVRPALLRSTGADGALTPSAAATLSYEFPRATLAEVAQAVSGVAPSTPDRWAGRFSPGGFGALLQDRDGAPVVAALTEQSALFGRHLRAALDGRQHAVLVDTGLYGTTRQLLAEGVPDVRFSSALLARSYRPGPPTTATVGLSVEGEGYSPLRRRTALLRYWHFVEWLFEPELPSVRTFADDGGTPRSNLEVPGWPERVAPEPGTPFAGVVDYLDGLSEGATERTLVDADRAWTAFRRAVVWPSPAHGRALAVGRRSHDFGTDATWVERAWQGPLAAFRGPSMWRGGEIARSGSALRLPLLAAVEAAYTVRYARRAATRLRRSA